MAIEFTTRRFTVDEYERMAELGIIGPDEHVELIDGEIITVPPSDESHGGGINRLTDLFIRRLAGRAVVQPQLPVRISDYSLPEPDLAILRAEPSFYADRRPRVPDVLAFVEISYSSVSFDRGTKLRAYARARVPEYWIINVRDKRIFCHLDPNDLGYANVRELHRGETIAFMAFPGDVFKAEALLPTIA